MKLLALVTVLLPLSALAAPAADDADGLFKRSRTCQIVGADYVNCREGTTTTSRVVTRLPRGSSHYFLCYVSGERVYIGGVYNA